MKWIFFSWLFLLDGFLSEDSIAFSVTIREGTVVKIVDGDTFDLLTNEKKTIRVRMNGIDSPERKQDFYKVAKDGLAAYVFKKQVQLNVTGYDRNKRSIATVWCEGKNINLEMIKQGWAWHYKKYSADTSFANAELQARMKKKGLWIMNNPVPPWQFRKK